MAHKNAGTKAPGKKQAVPQPEKRVYFKQADFSFLIWLTVLVTRLTPAAYVDVDRAALSD